MVMPMHLTRRVFTAGLALFAAGGSARAETRRDTVVADPATGRRIALRIRLPETQGRAPLILYSPGLGSGISNGAAWCEAWRNAGCVVVTMSHPVTNDEIWRTGRASFAENLAAALAGGQYPARVRDTTFVIGQCLSSLGIEGRIDADRIGVAGHSYGAITVQALAVEAARGKPGATIKAAIAFSPGVITAANAASMAAARMPFFVVTGDHDNYVTFSKDGVSRRLGVPLANRLAVYAALPKGKKQLLVLGNADHMTFAGEPIDGRRFSRDVSAAGSEATWARAAAITGAFWRQYLMQGEPRPREAYLAEVRAMLARGDRFEAG